MSERINVLITHPSVGSVWLLDAEIDADIVSGWIWDYSQRGSSLLPDDYSGERLMMWFPVGCVRKTEGGV